MILPRLSYFLSHRLDFALFLKQQGYDVIIACDMVENGINNAKNIADIGLTPYHIHIGNDNINPLFDIILILKLFKCYYSLCPDIVHHVATKPVLYGSLIAKIMHLAKMIHLFDRSPKKVINAVAGLGYVFSSDEIKAKILRPIIIGLYRYVAKSKNHHFVVQNHDDKKFLHHNIKIAHCYLHLIEGSGISLQEKIPAPFSPPIIVACLTRLLYDKGIADLAAAAKLLPSTIEIHLYGKLSDQKANITIDIINVWQQTPSFFYKGVSENAFKIYQNAHIAILPSYREGLPKSLLEAMACGLPIITCDTSGCNSLCHDGINGILVAPKNPEQIAHAIKKLAADSQLRQKMGEKSQEFIKTRFSHDIIHQKFLDLYQQ